jgi:hypothetical protein
MQPPNVPLFQIWNIPGKERSQNSSLASKMTLWARQPGINSSKRRNISVMYEVLTLAFKKIHIFWDMTLSELVGVK